MDVLRPIQRPDASLAKQWHTAGVLRSVLASCGRLLLGWASFGPRAGAMLAPRRPLAMPYGVAIAAGSAFWWFFGARVV